MTISSINGNYASGPIHSAGGGAYNAQYRSGAGSDSYQSAGTPKKTSIFKKALKLGGWFVGALAFKRYCLSPAALEKIAGHIPGFIKGPFNTIAETGVAKTVTGWGEKLLNLNESLWGKVYSKIGGEKGSQTYQQALNTMKEQGVMGLFSKTAG